MLNYEHILIFNHVDSLFKLFQETSRKLSIGFSNLVSSLPQQHHFLAGVCPRHTWQIHCPHTPAGMLQTKKCTGKDAEAALYPLVSGMFKSSHWDKPAQSHWYTRLEHACRYRWMVWAMLRLILTRTHRNRKQSHRHSWQQGKTPVLRKLDNFFLPFTFFQLL